LPIIDTTRDDLMLYLNPQGKTNNDVDYDSWVWIDNAGTKFEATLSGLNYSDSDGWGIDKDGASYLKLISGAKL
jgi:hypothetical protein